jgi:septin family protein
MQLLRGSLRALHRINTTSHAVYEKYNIRQFTSVKKDDQNPTKKKKYSQEPCLRVRIVPMFNDNYGKVVLMI